MQWWESDDVNPGWRFFDDQNMKYMGQDEQEEANTVARRAEKLGKAFQNYRRAIVKFRMKMVTKKVFCCVMA